METHIERLDCGHSESPHSDITRGYAVRPNGQRICYGCAEARDKANLLTETRYGAYLHKVRGAEHTLTGWPGWTLARVTALWETQIGGFMGRQTIWRFKAVDVHGQHWYGTSPGPGMYARMHKAKRNKENK